MGTYHRRPPPSDTQPDAGIPGSGPPDLPLQCRTRRRGGPCLSLPVRGLGATEWHFCTHWHWHYDLGPDDESDVRIALARPGPPVAAWRGASAMRAPGLRAWSQGASVCEARWQCPSRPRAPTCHTTALPGASAKAARADSGTSRQVTWRPGRNPGLTVDLLGHRGAAGAPTGVGGEWYC